MNQNDRFDPSDTANSETSIRTDTKSTLPDSELNKESGRLDVTELGRRTYLMGATAVGMASVGGIGATGLTAAQGTSGADLLWKFETDDEIKWSSPTVVDGTVFVGSHDHNVYALDATTGDKQWQFEANDRVRSPPMVADGTVFVGSHDQNLYALDSETGDKRWQFETRGGAVKHSPTVAGGTVFVGSDDHNVYALNAETGDKRWQFEANDRVKSPTAADGTVFVGSDGQNLYALDAETGGKRWQFEANDRLRSSPTIADGTVFVGSDDHNLYALDADTGEQQWQFETGGAVHASSPTVADGTVFVGNDDENVYALDAGTGDLRWQFETGGEVHSSPTVADGTVIVGSGDHHVYALDAETGEKQWQFETGGKVKSSPTVVSGTVFVGSWDHNVYALDAGVTGSSQGSRVNLGTLGHHHVWAKRAAGATSATEFTITDVDPADEVETGPGEPVNVTVTVENTGTVAGTDEVAFVSATDSWDVGTEANSGPEPFDAGVGCAVCNMTPDGETYEAWHGQVVHAGGTRNEFCSTGCMVEYVVYSDFYATSDSDIDEVRAVDFEDVYEDDGHWTRDGDYKELIDMDQGYFLLVPSGHSYYGMPMGNGSPLAFSSRDDAVGWIEANDIDYYEDVSEDDIVTLEELEPTLVDYRERRRNDFAIDVDAAVARDAESAMLDVTVGYWGEAEESTETITVTINGTTEFEDSVSLESGETWGESYELDVSDLPISWTIETAEKTADGTLNSDDSGDPDVPSSETIDLNMAENTVVTLGATAPAAAGEYDWFIATSDDESRSYTLSINPENEGSTADDDAENEETTADDDPESEESVGDDSSDGLPGFGIMGTLSAFGGIGYLLKRRLTENKKSRRIKSR